MSIAQAETLKRELTDRYVVVHDDVAELRRFAGLTGQVKTVNMNGRALVQFDGPVDISWYDVDPSYLKVVPAPPPKPKKEEKEPPAKAEKAPAPAKPAATQAKKLSPLEQARQQGAAKAAATEAAPPEPVAVVEAPPEPPAPVAAPEPEPEPAPVPAASSGLVTPGSTAEIIALARQQGAFKG